MVVLVLSVMFAASIKLSPADLEKHYDLMCLLKLYFRKIS